MTTNTGERLHALDALRAVALICGVVLHAAMSYLPGYTEWPLLDRTPSGVLALTFFTIHMFRMTLFFVIAGFFARLLVARRGLRGFVRNRTTRIVVPLVVGWMVFFPLTTMAVTWGTDLAVRPPAEAATGSPFAFPLLHFWFLYVLALIYAAAIPARQAMARLDTGGGLRRAVDAVMRLVLAGPWASVILATPLIGAFLVSRWLLWSGIPTPDQSLVPNVPAAVGFSSAFAIGWLLHRQSSQLDAIRRWWLVYLGTAVVLSLASLIVLGPDTSNSWSDNAPSARLYAVLYAVGVWSWTLGFIGVALRFFTAESAVLRYVSDASYWIYLAHLPLVFALQAVMKDKPLHWAVKFPIIVTVAFVVLFASYHLFVRFTVIGHVLNGVRRRRNGPRAAAGHPTRIAAR